MGRVTTDTVYFQRENFKISPNPINNGLVTIES